jgi:hypothetical protein
MLPAERRLLMPKIWALLKPGGVLFVNQTPNRYFPIEQHTTGLPLLNYLPARLAGPVARRFSKRIDGDESWETLLRKGIRGGAEKDVLRDLGARNGQGAVLLKPRVTDAPPPAFQQRVKRGLYAGIGRALGTSFGPWVRMAVRKA